MWVYGCAVPIVAIAPFGVLALPALNKDSTMHELSSAKDPVSQVNVV